MCLLLIFLIIFKFFYYFYYFVTFIIFTCDKNQVTLSKFSFENKLI